MSQRRRKSPAPAPKTKSRLERIVLIVGAVGGIGMLVTTIWHNSQQRAIDTARHVEQTVNDFKNEDPYVVEPLANQLRTLGDTAAAEALVSTVERKQRGRRKLEPVVLPDRRDSAQMLFARVDEQLRSQGPIPRGYIVDLTPTGGESVRQIEVLRLPRDSATATLATGESVSRKNVGGLWMDAFGRLTCGGECQAYQVCCRIVLVTP
jgi:hypothetical protein